MLFINKTIPWATMALAAVVASCAPTTTSSAPAISTPTPTYLFTAKLEIAKPLDAIPLVEGSTLIVEPLKGGSISGPYLNATITAGFAAATVAANNTITGKQVVQIPSIYLYGTTSDGLPFYVQESGIGPQAGQNTRLVVAVGGKYKEFQEWFILGQPVTNAERTLVNVEVFKIPLPAGVKF